MILKFKGLLAIKTPHDRSHSSKIEDVFIGPDNVRQRLQDADIQHSVTVVFEEHVWNGKLFERPPVTAAQMMYTGPSRYSSAMRGLSKVTLPPPPLFVGGENILSTVSQYIDKEVVLWVSDIPLTAEDFVRLGSEFSSAEKWQAAVMCAARALLLDSTLQRVASVLPAIVAVVQPGPIDNIETLHRAVNDVFLKLSPPESRTQMAFKSFNAEELYSVGDVYLLSKTNSTSDSKKPDPQWAAAAIPFLTKAVELQPDSAQYVFRLFEAIVWSGNNRNYNQEQLLELLNRAIQLAPHNEHYLRTRANIHEALGHVSEAEADRQKANEAVQLRLQREAQFLLDQERSAMEAASQASLEQILLMSGVSKDTSIDAYFDDDFSPS